MAIWITLGILTFIGVVGWIGWLLFSRSEEVLSNKADKYFDEQAHERKEMGWKSEK